MTVRGWLADREPSPPHVLRERVESLALSVADRADDPATTLLAAAEAALKRLADCEAGDRATALDLLAVDALVTYAFEFAAGTPDAIPELSARAMSRLSNVAAR